ncbi:MAG TPA: dTMP kinase [Verrucomicrobiae bacterium]|jgi:dTMP kinase|nr:dTMP kinase [Verrucomicrobiae bacterium]
MKKGIFITFEGTEGSGKSTQIKRAASFLRKKGRRVLILREPGGTGVGEAIRNVLLDNKHAAMAPSAELLLYLAARAQIVNEKILPALKAGTIVICDRFEDSTLAYQGYGRGFSMKDIEAVSQKLVRGTLKPRLTILLDVDPALGLKRGGRHDRMEKQSLVFHRKVRRGFLALAKREPRRYLVINTRQDWELTAKQIRERLGRVA